FLKDAIKAKQIKTPTSTLEELTQEAKQLVDDRLTERKNLRDQALTDAQTYRTQQNITTEEVSDQNLRDAIQNQQTQTPTSTLDVLTRVAKTLVNKRITERANLREQAFSNSQTYRGQQSITNEEVSEQDLSDTIQAKQTETPASTLDMLIEAAKQLVDKRKTERTNLKDEALTDAQTYRQEQNIKTEEVSDEQLKTAIETKQTENPTSNLDGLKQVAKTLVDDKKVEKALTLAQTYRQQQNITTEEISDEQLTNIIRTKQNNEPASTMEELTQVAKTLVDNIVDNRTTERTTLRETALSKSKTYRQEQNINTEEVSDEQLINTIQNQQNNEPTSTLEDLTQVAKTLVDNRTTERTTLRETALSKSKKYRQEQNINTEEVSDEQLINTIQNQQNNEPNSTLEDLTQVAKTLVDNRTTERTNLRDQAFSNSQTYRQEQHITTEELSDQTLRETIQTQQNNEPTSTLEVLTQVAKTLVDNRKKERNTLREKALTGAKEYRTQQNITEQDASNDQLINAIQTQQNNKPHSSLHELTLVGQKLVKDKKTEKQEPLIQRVLTNLKDYRKQKGIPVKEVTDEKLKEEILKELKKQPNSQPNELENKLKTKLLDCFTVETTENGIHMQKRGYTGVDNDGKPIVKWNSYDTWDAQYDKNGKQTQKRSYTGIDEQGKPIVKWNSYDTWDAQYDVNGKPTQQRRYTGVDAQGNPVANWTSSWDKVYDDNGNPTQSRY
ncbi:hypothetical protein, partial [Candidatus Phytoplasma pruni]